MNYRKLRFVENLILLMFPVSILVACTTNGTDQANEQLTSAEETLSIVREESPVFYADEKDLKFGKSLVENTNNTYSELTWAIEESTGDKYVIISPSAHLAVYSTANGVDQDLQDSVQTAHLKESNVISFPGKSVFHFNSDTYNIDAEDIEELKDHAVFLLENPEFSLTVSGHTDRTGSAEYNQVLSEQRAQLVMDILTTYGAPSSQIIVQGYGEAVPLNNIDNLEENRRVELEYSRALMISRM